MNPAVSAMLAILRDTEEIRRHVDDAMIAQQLEPIEQAEWLAGCEAVREARDRMAFQRSMAQL